MTLATIAQARAEHSVLLKQWWESYKTNGENHPETVRLNDECVAVVNQAVEKFATPQVAGCRTCEVYSIFGGPHHNGSRNCRSGSLASGGTRSHCSCATCF